MAISKKDQRRGTPADRPDEAAFQKVIDDGLAHPDVVAEAYGQALDAWGANGGTWPESAGDVVAVRPVLDPDAPMTLTSRLIQIRRRQLFKGTTT